MKLINLTPHPLNIRVSDTEERCIPVGGDAPRLSVVREKLGIIAEDIPIVRTTMGKPVGLPPVKPGVILIVSALVAEHPSVADRADLAYPGAAIRDEDGKIIGADGLCAGPGLAKCLRECNADVLERITSLYCKHDA